MDYDEDAHGTCDDDGPPESGPDAEASMLQDYYAAAVRQNKETEVLPEFGSLEHESASQYGIDPSDDYWELPRHVRALLTRNTPAIVSFPCSVKNYGDVVAQPTVMMSHKHDSLEAATQEFASTFDDMAAWCLGVPKSRRFRMALQGVQDIDDIVK